MPVIIPASEVEQGTDAWHALRLGIPTSSEYSRILKQDGKRSASWPKYVDELAVEKLSGQSNTFETWQMRLGHEQEPKARWLYEQMNQVKVEQVAFVYKDETRRTGSSTDGLVNEDGIIECKGGKGETHMERLRVHEVKPDKFPNKHFQQIQGELYVCEREWVDLLGFFPGMRMVIARVHRNEEWIKTLDQELEHFYEDLHNAIEFAKAA